MDYGPLLTPDGVQYRWNSHSISAAERCLRYYNWTVIEGWRSRNESVHLTFGSHYAAGLQQFFLLRAQGADREEAIHAVVKTALIATASWETDHAKNRFTLIRTLVWYFDEFEDDLPVLHSPDGTPAVEHRFALDLDDGNLLVGTLDRVVLYAGAEWIMDQKAQPLTAKVLCEDGWRSISDLHLGDKVAGIDGQFYPVTAILPQGKTKVFRVTFNDGTSVEAADAHLWGVYTYNGTYKVLHTKELIPGKHCLPRVAAIAHPHRDLPLHPFLLGQLLGDGYLAGNSIQISGKERPRCLDYLPEGDVSKKSSAFNYSWTISGGATLNAIRQLGLKGTKSRTKFIPPEYLYASIPQREELLHGLLSTDGSWNGNSRIYDTMSEQLAKDVCELTRSLGGQARYRRRNDGCFRLSLRMKNFPTGLGRRYVASVVELPPAETACISVAEAPKRLYITENHIPTHNTTSGSIGPYYFEQYKPHMQMSAYTFAGRAVFGQPIQGVIIDAAEIKVGFSRFARGLTYRTDSELQEWYEGAMWWIESAQRATREGYFPPNTASCTAYGGCPFRRVCASSPESRPNFLRADFVQSAPAQKESTS